MFITYLLSDQSKLISKSRYFKMCSIKTCFLFSILITVSKSRQVNRNGNAVRADEDKDQAGKFEGFIVGGKFADILDYPHSAFMSINCLKEDFDTFACGSSVINQVMLLTAAHCFEDCLPGTKVTVSVGDADRTRNLFYKVATFTNHPAYDPFVMKNDIALAMLAAPLTFSRSVKRVVLSKVGIYDQPATLAGWGVTDVMFFLCSLK